MPGRQIASPMTTPVAPRSTLVAMPTTRKRNPCWRGGVFCNRQAADAWRWRVAVSGDRVSRHGGNRGGFARREIRLYTVDHEAQPTRTRVGQSAPVGGHADQPWEGYSDEAFIDAGYAGRHRGHYH